MTTISRHNKVNQDKSVHCTSQTIEIVRVYYRLSPIKFIGLIFLADFMTLMKVDWGHRIVLAFLLTLIFCFLLLEVYTCLFAVIQLTL